MNTKTKRWLIWSSVLGLVALEMFMLFAHKENDLRKTGTVAASRSPLTGADEDRARQPRPFDAVQSIQSPVASEAAKSTAASNPLSLEALRKRVQPAGALLNEALLTFTSAQAYASFIKRAGGSGLILKDRLDELLAVRLGFSSLEPLHAELLDHPGDTAELSANYIVEIPRLPAPTDPAAGGDAPFGASVFSAMGINASADRSQWGKGVTVAVVDSGVGEHPTFRKDQVTHVDLVNDGQPMEGHGTAMASLIAGNMEGAQGVAPGAHLLDIRVAGGSGESDSFTLARGVTAAVQKGARVINVSMGSYGNAPVLEAAVKKAVGQGVVVVASAGNEQADVLAWPAAYAGVISVSGVDAKGQLAYFSNTGNPTIAAPAVGIPSAYSIKNKPYLGVGSGTSQSAALASGGVAAILSHGGNVMITINHNAGTAQAPKPAVGAGIFRLPTYQ